MPEQLSIYDIVADEIRAEELIAVEALFEPNGRRRCATCRKRLHAFDGRLICVSPYCTGGPS